MVGGAQQCQQRFVDIQELYRKIRKLEYVDVVPKQDSDGADNDMSIDAAMNRWQQQRPASAATASSGTGAWLPGSDSRRASAATPVEPTADDSCRASATDSCRASASGSQGGAPIGINVKAGAALSMFDPLSWVYSFVEFFYGDCLPGDPRRDDAARLSFEEVFECLKRREELQYSLPTDAQPCKAGPMSRWDSAPMSLLFGSTLRSLRMLRASKLSILRTQNAWETFKQDFQAIAECTAEEFQRAFKYETHGGAKTLVEVFSAPGAKEKHPKVHTALKHVLCQTGTVPLTEGYKMNVRHQSFSQTLCFGALKLFLTTNFADTYCPLVLKLYDVDDSGEATELVGEVTVNLFEDAPTMPTQQRMHKIVAQHPSVQARLFLLMEQVAITELLCADRAFIGNKVLDCLDPGQSHGSMRIPTPRTARPAWPTS